MRSPCQLRKRVGYSNVSCREAVVDLVARVDLGPALPLRRVGGGLPAGRGRLGRGHCHRPGPGGDLGGHAARAHRFPDIDQQPHADAGQQSHAYANAASYAHPARPAHGAAAAQPHPLSCCLTHRDENSHGHGHRFATGHHHGHCRHHARAPLSDALRYLQARIPHGGAHRHPHRGRHGATRHRHRGPTTPDSDGSVPSALAAATGMARTASPLGELGDGFLLHLEELLDAGLGQLQELVYHCP